MNNKENNNKINPDNWTYTSYSDGNLSALITFGADPESINDTFLYFVTVLDAENNEMFQKQHTSIDAACNEINGKYAKYWDFINKTKPTKEGGCSTCIAH